MAAPIYRFSSVRFLQPACRTTNRRARGELPGLEFSAGSVCEIRTIFISDQHSIKRGDTILKVPASYIDRMGDFVRLHPDQLLGRLATVLAEEHLDTNPDTAWSWKSEIVELQKAFRELLDLLPATAQWAVLLEYVLPGIGQRVDCVLLGNDVIYVIEYKGGRTATARAALKQAQEYAMNLADFHEESRHRTVIPIAFGGFKTLIPLDPTSKHQGAAVGIETLSETIFGVSTFGGQKTRRSTPLVGIHRVISRCLPSFRRLQRCTRVMTYTTLHIAVRGQTILK